MIGARRGGEAMIIHRMSTHQMRECHTNGNDRSPLRRRACRTGRSGSSELESRESCHRERGYHHKRYRRLSRRPSSDDSCRPSAAALIRPRVWPPNQLALSPQSSTGWRESSGCRHKTRAGVLLRTPRPSLGMTPRRRLVILHHQSRLHRRSWPWPQRRLVLRCPHQSRLRRRSWWRRQRRVLLRCPHQNLPRRRCWQRRQRRVLLRCPHQSRLRRRCRQRRQRRVLQRCPHQSRLRRR